MTPEAALEALKAHIEPGRAAHVAAYMKVEREYLGVPLPAVNALTQDWRRSLTLEERVSLAEGLWRTDIHEARIAAAKLLTQARIKGDEPVWRLIVCYVADREWFIQKAVAWWLRELSKHDPKRAEAFLAEHGAQMKAFARKEAGKYL